MIPLLVFTTLLVAGKSAAINIDVDYSAASDLRDFAERVRLTLLAWYPWLENNMYSPTFTPVEYINIRFDPNYDGVAYASGNQIVGAVNYYRSHQDDVGSMIHEMIHVIQGYRRCAGWVTEGVADYWRYYFFEPDRKPGKPGSGNSYTDGYGVSAYFINFIQVTYGDMLYWVNKDCREGTYEDDIWPRLLGRTLDQLWQDMLNAPPLALANNRTTRGDNYCSCKNLIECSLSQSGTKT